MLPIGYAGRAVRPDLLTGVRERAATAIHKGMEIGCTVKAGMAPMQGPRDPACDDGGRGDRMKINDVDLTLFAWAGIPATRYGPLTGKFGGRSQLGLLSVDRIEKKKIALLREKRKP